MTGAQLKRDGQQTALDHAGEKWTASTLDKLRAFCKVRKEMGIPQFRLEEFRAAAIIAEWDLPPSPNAWGAFSKVAENAGVIRQTGQQEHAKSLKTHAHRVSVWIAV